MCGSEEGYFLSSQASRSRTPTIERYNRTVRYAWLARILFGSIEQMQDMATSWLWTHNHKRQNMALGGIMPMQKLASAT